MQQESTNQMYEEFHFRLVFFEMLPGSRDHNHSNSLILGPSAHLAGQERRRLFIHIALMAASCKKYMYAPNLSI